jgi:hypothetical protein
MRADERLDGDADVDLAERNRQIVSPDRLREIARNLFESAMAGDDRTLGENAMGLLAFQQLGGRCDIVSARWAATRRGLSG